MIRDEECPMLILRDSSDLRLMITFEMRRRPLNAFKDRKPKALDKSIENIVSCSFEFVEIVNIIVWKSL